MEWGIIGDKNRNRNRNRNMGMGIVEFECLML